MPPQTITHFNLRINKAAPHSNRTTVRRNLSLITIPQPGTKNNQIFNARNTAYETNEIVFIINDESDKKRISELSQSLEDLKLKNQQYEINKNITEKKRLASIDNEIEQNKINEKKNAFFNDNPNFRVAIRTGIDTVVDGKYINY